MGIFLSALSNLPLSFPFICWSLVCFSGIRGLNGLVCPFGTEMIWVIYSHRCLIIGCAWYEIVISVEGNYGRLKSSRSWRDSTAFSLLLSLHKAWDLGRYHCGRILCFMGFRSSNLCTLGPSALGLRPTMLRGLKLNYHVYVHIYIISARCG